MNTTGKLSVLSVDDNPHVGEALRPKVLLDGSFAWHG